MKLLHNTFPRIFLFPLVSPQEYEEAYKAYSAALSISPLGPSSHIYLSNRAAALLSLKRYSAASVDARRAITLAPTFGKAHARLGQSLYFLKDYAGAVAAYENAFQFEPDNQVTWTYLNKAKKKFARENEKKRKKEEEQIDLINRKVLEKEKEREVLKMQQEKQKEDKQRREQQQQQQQKQHYIQEEQNEFTQEEPVYEEEDATADGASVTDSVNLANMAISVIGDNATNKEKGVSVLSTHDEGDDIDQLVAAVDRGETSIVRGKLQAALDSSTSNTNLVSSGGGKGTPQSGHHPNHGNNNNHDTNEEYDYNDDGGVEDPDFDEALRLQEVAAIKLVNKEYRRAVEEFSAALFLVPDDTNLTPQLYVGRAHALNGLNRHEGALNDSMMALGRSPELPEAHVVLARTYFYVKNFNGAVSSFETAKRILKERKQGDKLSPLDELYYEKAIENSKYQQYANDDDGKSYRSLALPSDKPIPKLRPPRFVSRQEVSYY